MKCISRAKDVNAGFLTAHIQWGWGVHGWTPLGPRGLKLLRWHRYEIIPRESIANSRNTSVRSSCSEASERPVKGWFCRRPATVPAPEPVGPLPDDRDLWRYNKAVMGHRHSLPALGSLAPPGVKICGKSLKLPALAFSHLENGSNKACLACSLQEWNEVSSVPGT